MRINIRERLLLGLMRRLKARDPRETDISLLQPEAVRSILVVSSTALGDTLMSTPALHAIRLRYPQAKITGHIARNLVELFDRHPDLDAVIPYQGGYRQFVSTVRAFQRERFDLAVILHGNDPQATVMAWLSGAPFVVKLPNDRRFGFLLSNAQARTQGEQEHAITHRLAIAALVQARSDDARMVMPVLAEDTHWVSDFLTGQGISAHPLIGFQLGASSRARMWPVDRFVALAGDLLKSYPNARFVLTGSPAEAKLCDQVAARIGASAMVSAGRVPLCRLPALTARLDALVTGDTGTMHLAVAVGTPVVAMFAVSDACRSGPYQDLDRHVIIQKPRPRPDIRSKSNDQSGMEQISVNEVFQGVVQILERNPDE